MGDVSADEVIDVCPFITNQMIEYLEHFLYSLEEFDKEYMSGPTLNSTDWVNYTTEIQEWQKDHVDNVDKHVLKNAKYLQTLNEEIKQQKILAENMARENIKIQKETDVLRENIFNVKKKMENLMELRDQVQICKLLTNTSFTYKGSIISGYVVSKQANCFELDPEKLSKNDIMNCLYNLIKKVFCDNK